MASAFDHSWKHGRKRGFHGEYAATSVGTCYNRPVPYPPNIPPGTVLMRTLSQQSTNTFNRDCTRTVQGKHIGINFPPFYEAMPPTVRDISWDFTYEVTYDGKITMGVEGVWTVPGTSPPVITITSGEFSKSGNLSADHKTIILGNVTTVPSVLTLANGVISNALCNISRVLIRVGE